MRTERPKVAEAIDRLDAASLNIREGGAQSQVVTVDPAEDCDATHELGRYVRGGLTKQPGQRRAVADVVRPMQAVVDDALGRDAEGVVHGGDEVLRGYGSFAWIGGAGVGGTVNLAA